jgi:epoxyqueuosine reductase
MYLLLFAQQAQRRGMGVNMQDITGFIKDELLCHGADLVGIGDLTGLPDDVRCGMPIGICVAVKYPREVIKGIAEQPTKAYYEQYNHLNNKLDMLAVLGADALRMLGYEAIAQTQAYVELSETDYATKLPHKTVATRAGLGWIGKSALLVTKQYGSMIRISSILTNAPLKTAKPVNASKCGTCEVCQKACPAGAVTGKLWSVDMNRDALFDAPRCRQTVRQRALSSFGVEITLCGRCINACPYTQHYINSEEHI